MKKIYLLAAAAAMFASCAQDELITEVEPSNVEQAIGFGTVFDKMTRSAENDKDATLVKGLENYNTSFSVWGNKNAASAVSSVFIGQPVNYESTDWTYSPKRFWDKSAASYMFYAVSPIDPKWKATTDGNTAITTMDNISTVKFTYDDYVADGLSLPQSATDPTAQPQDVFTAGTDLMIATDQSITGWNNGEKVPLLFNHILSRFNIAVKSEIEQTYNQKNTKVSVKVDETNNQDYDLYKSDKNTGKYIKDGENFYALAGDAAPYVKAGTPYEKDDDETISNVTEDNTDSPKSGIVKITSINVFNMFNQGKFNEMGFDTSDEIKATAIDATILAAGTDTRWIASNVNTSGFGVSFDNNDKATSFSYTPDGPTNDDYVKSTPGTTTNVLSTTYNYFYQGLVVPQTINYEALPITGLTEAASAKPYIRIQFTVDGEPFTYYYNLAGTFQNVYDTYKVNGREVYKTTLPTSDAPVYLYKSEDDYYLSKDGTSEKATIITATTSSDGTTITYKNGNNEVVYYKETDKTFYTDENCTLGNEVANAYVLGDVVTRADATTIDAFKAEAIASCSTTFCEGWQNNLLINIKPATIEFKADVFEWKTKESHGFTIQ